MRLVHVTVPAGKREAVTSTLDDEGVDYVMTDEVSGRDYTAVVTFPLPTEAVEPVLDALREDGLSDEAFTVIVDAQTVISRRFDELQEQYAEAQESEERIAREELQAAADELMPDRTNYLVLTVVSVVIATAGVLLNSAAVVVGSMVIAPLIGPAMATSVGTVIDDADLFRQGIRQQVLGILLAALAASLFAVAVRWLRLVPPGLDPLALPQVAERAVPDFLSLVIALGAGIAGAMSLRSGVSASLVGVMIAVALVPPIAVVGVGVAWVMPMVALGAAILATVNVLSINLAALVTFWYSGYRPEHWFRLGEARSATLKRVAALAVAILVLSTFLGGVTFSSYRTAVDEDEIRDQVETVLSNSERLELLEVEVMKSDNPLVRSPERVVVTVGVRSGTQPPDLATRLRERLSEYDVTVRVRFVEFQRAG